MGGEIEFVVGGDAVDEVCDCEHIKHPPLYFLQEVKILIKCKYKI